MRIALLYGLSPRFRKAIPMAVKRGTLLALMLLLISIQIARPGFASPPDATQGDASIAITTAEASGERAFGQIRDAEREGGNVTALSVRFNGALELLDEARAFMDEGLYGQAIASANGANELFSAIDREGLSLELQAAAEASNRRIEVLLTAPIIAILITLISYYVIRLWRKRQIGRILEMEIREAEAP